MLYTGGVLLRIQNIQIQEEYSTVLESTIVLHGDAAYVSG